MDFLPLSYRTQTFATEILLTLKCSLEKELVNSISSVVLYTYMHLQRRLYNCQILVPEQPIS